MGRGKGRGMMVGNGLGPLGAWRLAHYARVWKFEY